MIAYCHVATELTMRSFLVEPYHAALGEVSPPMHLDWRAEGLACEIVLKM
jgi:hypothetical protein